MFIMRNKSSLFNSNRGFTLLEILISLFIFSIVSLILVSGLHTVVNAQAGTEAKAERLRKLQMTMLIMQRDVEQTLNRPIVNSSGHEDPAFIGDNHGFTLTHTGFANPMGNLLHSSLQRTAYTWHDETLARLSWAALDQTPETKTHTRRLLTDVTEASFQYLDSVGKFQTDWPDNNEKSAALPRAIRINLTIAHWGKFSQLLEIPAQVSRNTQAPPGVDPGKPEPKKETVTE